MVEGFYLLRWRFDYATRPAKYGMWSQPAVLESDTAAFCPKDGLVRAAIEGRHSITREDKIIAACDGQDFVNFQWVAEAHFNPFGGGITQQNVVGLKLVTSQNETTVFASGKVVQDERHP